MDLQKPSQETKTGGHHGNWDALKTPLLLKERAEFNLILMSILPKKDTLFENKILTVARGGMAQLVKCLSGKCEDLNSIPRSTTTTTTTIQKRNCGQEVLFSVNSAQRLEHLEESHGVMTWALTCSCVILRTQRDIIKVHECLGGKCGMGRFENEFSGPLIWLWGSPLHSLPSLMARV